MKKTIIIGVVILLALVGFITSKKSDTAIDQGIQGNKVAATIFPLYDITQKIAGDEFEVVLVVPSGASPHTFDPQPSLIKELQGAQAVFAIGHTLDNWSSVIAESIDAPVVTVDNDLHLRATVEEHEEHTEEDIHGEHINSHNEDYLDDNHDGHEVDHTDDEHEGHDHGPIDPHYWLSLRNAEQIAVNIAEELSELDPKNSNIYSDRAKAYLTELEALEMELKDNIGMIPNKNIMAFHGAWYYFAEEFNLNIIGTFQSSAGKEPTPQYLEELQHAVEDHNVSTLFIEPQLSQESIQSFANDHNLSIATIDPLGGVEGRNSYIELMRYNVEQVISALSK